MPASEAMIAKYPWPTVWGEGAARSQTPTAAVLGDGGGCGGASPRMSSQWRRYVTTANPASRSASSAPRSEMTTGRGPGTSRGTVTWTDTKVFSSDASRTIVGRASIGGGGTTVVRCVQAPRRTTIAMRARPLLLLATLAAAALGCAPRPLLERAIRARGGPLGSLVRQVDAEVYAAFPGTWQWRTAFMLPDRYAWTVFTTGEPMHYLFDGQVVR